MTLQSDTRILKFVLLGVSIMLFALALVARFLASDQAAKIVGPGHLAVGAERVFVHAHGAIHVLSRSGELVERVHGRDLGLVDAPIDMRVLGNGRLLLAEQSPARIRFCDTGAWSCRAVRLAGTVAPPGQYKMIEHESGEGFLLSDSGRGILWRIELGRQTSGVRLDTPGTLTSPNHLLYDRRGHVWVADSGHGRLVAMDPNRAYGVVKEIVANRGVGGHEWPVMLAAGPGDGIWVTQTEKGAARGALFRYSGDDSAPERVALPVGAYPTDLAMLNSKVLVTDMDRFVVYEVDTGTLSATPFGGPAFRKSIAEIRERRHLFDSISLVAMVAVVVSGLLIVAAAVWLTPKHKRWTTGRTNELAGEPPASAGQVKVTELYWLKRDPKTTRFLRWIVPGYLLIVVIAILSLVGVEWFIGQFGEPEEASTRRTVSELRSMIVFLVLMFGGLWPVMKMGETSLRKQLGTDGTYLYVRDPDGHFQTVVPEFVVYGVRQIMHGNKVIPVQTGKGHKLYQEGEVENYVLPLLARARRLNPFQMAWYQVRVGEPQTVYSLVFLTILVAYLYATGLWRVLLG